MRLAGSVLVAALLLPCARVAFAEPALFPWPQRYEVKAGVALLSPQSAVQSDDDALLPLAKRLAEELQSLAGSSSAAAGVPIQLALTKANANPEGYALFITPRRVRIEAASAAGVFYGTRTLLQLLLPHKAPWRVPAAHIQDAPRFAHRGMLFDVARHFYTVSELERFLDLLAAYKLNVFHWHLSDDQGWRLQISSRPKLGQIAAFREDRRQERFALPAELRAPLPATVPLYGGFYTEADVRRVVAYAAARHITVIPELDWPGHSQAALAAYPDLSCAEGKTYKVAPGAVYPFSDPLCPCKPGTMKFVDEVLAVVVALFPGPFIHIGGDEVNTQSWNTPVCERFRQAHGLTDNKALQTYFVSQVAAAVVAHGRQPIVWQEAAEHGVPPRTTTMAWLSAAPVGTLANAGHDVINVDSSVFYFDKGNADEGPGYAGWRKVYRYNPLPRTLLPGAYAHVLGVQGALWTEMVQTFAKVQTSVLPRVAALAEVAWSQPPLRTTTAPARLRAHLAWLAGQGFAAFVPLPLGVPARKVFLRNTRVQLKAPEPGFDVHYTTDGADPTAASPLAARALLINASTTLKARTILRGHGTAMSDVLTANLVRAVPAAAKAVDASAPGLLWSYHPGRTADARHATMNPPTKTGVIEAAGLPAELRGLNTFGLIESGLVTVAQTGVHTFCTTSNDGSVLFINDEAIVENDFIHGERTRCGEVALAAGAHAFKLLYFEDFDREALSVSHAFGDAPPQPLPSAAYSHTPDAKAGLLP
ncbi:MAG: family 20 glycosylhydrolase [Deltaproteobacteria bacterium]|nr:family 20 glycosylhydrolase [Deltaproteobacteria bacterium]